MKEQDEITRLNERIETLERELRTANDIAWFGLVTSTWAHWIANRVVTIKDNVDLIRDLEKKHPNEKLSKYLNRIYKSAREMIDEPLAAPSLSEAPIISVNDFLADYTSTVHLRHRLIPSDAFQVRLESTVEAHVKVDPNWLRRTVDFIVENAQEAMQHSPKKILTISTALVGNEVEIRFSDTGPGISEALRSQIFKSPVMTPARKGHSGFGLLLARMILQAFGGDIRLDEVKREGAVFVISLPRS